LLIGLRLSKRYTETKRKILSIEGSYLEVSVKVLPKLKIAHVIGKAVWDQKGDIRDVISIGKLVRKNDGPEEVEQILSTMTKYGEKNKH
jgi:hypothetical protein